VYPPEGYSLTAMRDPEWFYPGDQYVDWIGLSVVSRVGHPHDGMPFISMASETYRQLRTKHPEKPIMISELARNRTDSQARWLENTYETIKTWPGIKGVNYWDIVNRKGGVDNTLNDESKETLREIFKNPYFIGAS
jgi:hypothetical protein